MTSSLEWMEHCTFAIVLISYNTKSFTCPDEYVVLSTQCTIRRPNSQADQKGPLKHDGTMAEWLLRKTRIVQFSNLIPSGAQVQILLVSTFSLFTVSHREIRKSSLFFISFSPHVLIIIIGMIRNYP